MGQAGPTTLAWSLAIPVAATNDWSHFSIPLSTGSSRRPPKRRTAISGSLVQASLLDQPQNSIRQGLV